jgi:hypothetical protein
MSLLRQKKVWIPLVAFGVVLVMFVVVTVIGRFSSVPEDERIQVAPTSEEPTVDGPNDPEKPDSSVVMALPETNEPQRLATAVAQVVGSPDTARFERGQYVAAIASEAPEIPNEGKDPTTPSQWAEQIVSTAWKQDPWEDRAKYKATDTFTPQTVKTADTAKFLDYFAPESKSGAAEAREYLTDQGLVVMEVHGTVVREVTDPKDQQRKEQDMGEQTWTVAMLCPDKGDCKVFLALSGSVSSEEG